MRLLLDTHALLWACSDPDRLGRRRALVEDPRTDLLVSAASAWEIAIKHELGRLELPDPPSSWLPRQMRNLDATALPIHHDHALAVAGLPPIHTDPFDRLLVAQALRLDLPLLSADPILTRYGVDVLAI